ncbi:hypothetical protein Csa_002453, partial [Cucumis sativus]
DPEVHAVKHKDHEESGRDELFRILNALKVSRFHRIIASWSLCLIASTSECIE